MNMIVVWVLVLSIYGDRGQATIIDETVHDNVTKCNLALAKYIARAKADKVTVKGECFESVLILPMDISVK